MLLLLFRQRSLPAVTGTVAATMGRPTVAVAARLGESASVAVSALARPVMAAQATTGEGLTVAGTMARPTAAITSREGVILGASGMLARPILAVADRDGDTLSVTASLGRPTAAITSREGVILGASGMLARPILAVADRDGDTLSVSASIARPAAVVVTKTGDRLVVNAVLGRPLTVTLPITFWDASNQTGNMSVDPTGLLASTNTTDIAGIKTTTSVLSGSSIYFEFVVTNPTPNTRVGFSAAGFSLFTSGGIGADFDGDSSGFGPDGSFWCTNDNESSGAPLLTWNSGDTVMVAAQVGNNVWLGVNGIWSLLTGNWPPVPQFGSSNVSISDDFGYPEYITYTDSGTESTSVALRTSYRSFQYPVPPTFCAWDDCNNVTIWNINDAVGVVGLYRDNTQVYFNASAIAGIRSSTSQQSGSRLYFEMEPQFYGSTPRFGLAEAGFDLSTSLGSDTANRSIGIDYSGNVWQGGVNIGTAPMSGFGVYRVVVDLTGSPTIWVGTGDTTTYTPYAAPYLFSIVASGQPLYMAMTGGADTVNSSSIIYSARVVFTSVVPAGCVAWDDRFQAQDGVVIAAGQAIAVAATLARPACSVHALDGEALTVAAGLARPHLAAVAVLPDTLSAHGIMARPGMAAAARVGEAVVIHATMVRPALAASAQVKTGIQVGAMMPRPAAAMVVREGVAFQIVIALRPPATSIHGVEGNRISAAGQLGRPVSGTQVRDGARLSGSMALARPGAALQARQGERAVVASALARPVVSVAAFAPQIPRATIAGHMPRPVAVVALGYLKHGELGEYRLSSAAGTARSAGTAGDARSLRSASATRTVSG